MLSVFAGMGSGQYFWLALPFSVLASWVFWMMEAIGEYSENPFEGSYNDVPISAITRSIEIDIRQMLDEPNETLPKPLEPMGEHRILS
jgi:putative membrane protein